MARLCEIGAFLAAFLRPYADSATFSGAPECPLDSIDGRTAIVVTPAGSARVLGRGGTATCAYTYEIGVLRLLKADESPLAMVAYCEWLATRLLTSGLLECDAEIARVETTVGDADSVRRRRQFVCVLTVEAQDCRFETADALGEPPAPEAPPFPGYDPALNPGFASETPASAFLPET